MKPKSTSLIAALMALGATEFSAQANSPDGVSLSSNEIRKALAGKSIRYSPPGWAEVAMYEEFHSDGVWSGVEAGRGAWSFSGRWLITANQICVTADAGTSFERWHSGQSCRKIWQDRKTGLLRTYYPWAHPSSSSKSGTQTLAVSDLALDK
ncbi:hypothetical protein [Sphingomonas sp. UYP23]